MIPLFEVTTVKAMGARHTENHVEAENTSSSETNMWTSLSSISKFISEKQPQSSTAYGNAEPVLSQYDRLLQIKTAPEGFNSGRTYYIQSNSEMHRDEIVDDLTKIAKHSSARKIAASRFRASQLALKRVYDSSPAQIFVGLLILSVRMISLSIADFCRVTTAPAARRTSLPTPRRRST
jgi:hypothetical protein